MIFTRLTAYFDPISAEKIRYTATGSKAEVSILEIGGSLTEDNEMTLLDLYNINLGKEQRNYTDESWSAFTHALNNTEQVLEKVGASWVEVDQATINLEAAIAGLQLNEPVVTSVELSVDPSSIEIPTAGTVTAQAKAVVKDENGEAIEDKTLTYSIPETSGVAIDSATGLITVSSAATKGDIKITAAYEGITGTANLSLLSSAVSPTPDPTPDPTSDPTPAPVPTSKPEDNHEPTEPTDSTEPTEPASPKVELTDIGNHWAKQSIEKSIELGFVVGYGDGTFRPNDTITRGEFATMLARALKLELGNTEFSFADKSETPVWAQPFIQALAKAGFISGNQEGAFLAKNKITRSELVVMVVRALGLEINLNEALVFDDANQVPEWAKPYVAAAAKAGLVKGNGDGKFNPNASSTRAEAVTLILAMLNNVK